MKVVREKCDPRVATNSEFFRDPRWAVSSHTVIFAVNFLTL
jgi:hypothetical protein